MGFRARLFKPPPNFASTFATLGAMATGSTTDTDGDAGALGRTHGAQARAPGGGFCSRGSAIQKPAV